MQGRKFCAMLVLLATVICGAWGRTYRWVGTTSEDSPGNWKSYVNSWEAAKSSSGTITEWTDPSNLLSSGSLYHSYPDNGSSNTDTAYIDASSGDVYIRIDGDTNCSNVYVEGNNTIHFIVSSGKTFTIQNLIIGHNTSYSSSAEGDTYANDQDSKLEKSVNIQISGGGTLNANTTKYVNKSTESSVSIEDNSTFVTGAMNVTSTGNIQITGDGTGTYTSAFTDQKTLIDAENLTAGSTATGGTVVVTTSTYYWTGNANDGKKWTTSGNWAPNADGSGVVRTGTYPGHANKETAVFVTFTAVDGKYPVDGFKVADSSYVLNIKNNKPGTDRISIASITTDSKIPSEVHCYGPLLFWGVPELNELVIESDSTQLGNTMKISEKLTINEGASVWHSGGALDIKNFDNKGGYLGGAASIIFSGVVLNTGEANFNNENVAFNGGYSGTGTLTVASGTLNFNGGYSGTGTLTVASGTLNFNGGYSGTGTLSVSTGTITFGTDTTNTVKELTVSDEGKITNLSNNAVNLVDVTLPAFSESSGTTKGVTFTGNFKSTGNFGASSAGTYFINGNVDFSTCTNFSINATDDGGATVFFYQTTGVKRTFTTKSGMSFSNFYFAGNVDIVFNGEVSVANKCLMSVEKNEYKQNSDYVVTFIEGEENGHLSANATAPGDGAVSLGLGDDDDITLTSVRGTLILNANVTCKDHFAHHEGKTLKVGSEKILTINKDYRGFGGVNAPKNEIVVNKKGQILVTANFGAGAGNDAEVTVEADGNDYGTISVGGFMGMQNPSDYRGRISLLTNNGTIQTKTLYVEKIISSGIEEFNKNGGELTVTDWENSKFGNVTIAASSSLKLNNDIIVSGNWDNNAGTTGFDADGKNVYFKGENQTVSGSTAFAKAIFEGNTTFSAGNSFTDFTCETGGVKIGLGTSTTQSISGKLTLKGADGNRIQLNGNGKFIVSGGEDSEHYLGEYLSIGENVKISQSASEPVEQRKFLAKHSSPQNNNYATVCANGWKFEGLIYKWTGATSTAWSTATNWDVGIVPDVTSIITYADSVTNQPVLDDGVTSGAVTIGHITITDGNSLSLNGKSFAVTGICDDLPADSTFDIQNAFVNNGTVILTGKETVSLPTDKVLENGIWHFKDDGTNGVVKKIDNLAYNKLIISGNVLLAPGYNTVETSDKIQLGVASEETTITGAVTFSSPVTLANNATINGNGGSIKFEDNVTGTNGTETLSLTGENISFDKSFTNASLSISNSSKIIFSDANTFNSLSFTGSGTEVQFAAGKTQTVTGTFSANGGSGTGNEILLTSTDTSSKWKLKMPNFDSLNPSASFPTFKNTKISYSEAETIIAHAWNSSVTEAVDNSTIKWFISDYYWLGSKDDSWTTADKWYFKIKTSSSPDTYTYEPAGRAPTYANGQNSIFVGTENESAYLLLSDDIKIKSVTVEKNSTLDMQGNKLNADEGHNFINNGTVRLYGKTGQIIPLTLLVTNGEESTVEYYLNGGSSGSFESLEWGTEYENLIFGAGIVLESGTSVPIKVRGTTKIINGSGNSIELIGENEFNGLVIVGDESDDNIVGGDIIINSKETLKFGFVHCSSLEVKNTAKFPNVVGSPVIFSGENAKIDRDENISAEGITFKDTVTFSGKNAELFGDNTFNADVTFTASTTISGSNTFHGNVSCTTGGVTLTFADGSVQTIDPSPTTKKLVLNGNDTSRVTLSGNAKIVVPKNNFEGSYLSIPSNLVITSDPDSSPVEYGAYSVANSVPSSANPSQNDYVTLFKNGWDLGYVFNYVWTGYSDSSWSKKENWDIGIVPGISSAGVIAGLSGNTTVAKVSIPDGKTNYPEVDVTGGVSVHSLEIGTSGANPHNSSIKLTSNPVSVTETEAGLPLLKNFGTIEYTGSARITNGDATPLPINDAANNGIVLYSGGTPASPLEISTSASSTISGADYANLVITGSASTSSPIKVSGDVIVDASDSSVSLACGDSIKLGNSATITKCKNLTLSSPAGISISAQNEINLSGALTLNENTTLSLGTKNLTFASYSCASDKSDTIEASAGGTITQTGGVSSTIGKLNLTSGVSPYSLNGGTGGLVINSAVYGSSSITTSGNVTLAGTTSPDKIDVLKISAGKTILSGDNFVSSVEIDSGAVLQTGTASASTVHLSVNGDWTNNAGESGFVANSGTVEFTSSATISGNNSFNKAVFDENMSFGGNNSFSEFVCESAGKSLIFAAGSNQTVTKLTIRGTDSGKINLTGIGEWQITPLNHAQISIAHAIITNSKNTDSEPIIVYAKNGYNTDGTGNTNWIFAGHKYIWTGAASTDWDTTSNWSPASVPREYADVEIPGGKTNYPKLTQDLNLKNDEKIFVVDTNGDGINENESVTSSVAIDSGAVFDFAGNNLTVNALSSEGRIRVLGTESIAAAGDSGIKNLPLDSSSVLTGVIEYYGDFGTRETPNFGDKFSLLEFTAGSSGEISGSISVTGKTLISNGAGAALSLSGDNTFTGDVKITSAGNIVLKGKKDDSNSLALLGDVDCSKLNLKSDVVLNGNVTTTDSQNFEGKVFLDSGIIFNAGSSLVSFGADILSKSENSAITLESEVSLGGNVTTALSQTFKKNMTLLSDVVFTAGSGIKFDSASELSITSDKSAKFKSPVTSNCDLAITVPTVDFDLNASFKNTESTNSLSLKTGTSLSFKNAAFEAGKLIVEEGSSFSQTGVNSSTAVQKVYGLENNGSCVWDSASEGGTLVLSGSISGTKAGEIIFNKKNVTLSATPIIISGVFFDLTVPGGINATNGAGLIVRRNFIVEGAYLHNDQNLTLGTVSFADGRKYASANNEDGSAGLISCASSNLGNVTVVQETTRKKFATNIVGISFSLDDATAAAGSVEFAEKFKTLSLTNAASTNFAILFDSSCEITNDVIFGTNGNVIFGTKENSSCIFANSVEHTAGDSKLAGSVKAASAKFARSVLTQNTKIDCDSNSVIFTDVVDSDSPDTPRALSIGTESSATSVKFEKSAGTSNPLASLLVYGNAEFGGNLVSEGIINLKGDILAFVDVNLLSKNSYILADGSASRTVGAASGSLTFASELFVDIDASSTVTISSDLTWQKILCAYSGKISAGAVNLAGTNLVLFGSSYSADDPRYSGSDSRFAYFGYESLAYKPSSGTAGFKAEFSTIGTKVLLSENFYANGLDFAGCSFVIPNQSASNPLFNSTSVVTEKQWGIPYAVVFNSEIANCSAGSLEGAAFVTAAKNQNVTDRSGNSGFQFSVPQISGAYSVSDSVVCLSFDMSLENSNGEVSSTISLVSALENGGIFYNGKSLAFDGKFYTKSDGTNCSVPLSESNLALTDIPAHTPLYLKVSSAQNNWNTDATATFAGTEDSTDRSGIHRNRTTDLSLFEGLFFAAEGKTMCRNYGIGLWSENDSGYTDAGIFATIDKARPVLVDFFAGQELHSKNTGSADSQKFYDSHNFVELRYSEPVDIGNLLAGATEQNQNQQAQTDFDSAEKHGGAITNNSGSDGMTISGFVSIEKGELTAGYKSGSAGSYSFNSDTNKCHALYRKFSKNAGEAEKIFPSRIRISVAGYVDEENPVSLGGSDFHNWIGYIDSSSSPAGAVVPLANRFITDLAVDSDGLSLKNIFDENNSSRSLSVNDRASTSSSSLYGEWDCSHPVFAAYVTNFNGSDPNVSWINGDGENRQYEMLGTVDSNTNAYIDTIEMHLFDNTQNYSADDEYKWIARKGWISSGGNVIPGFEAPESSGGSRAIPSSSAMTLGGIRRSSLDGAISAFTYKYSLDGVESDFRTFAEKDIAQHVKSPLFRVESLSETFTDNDEPYLGLTINPMDSKLPIRTTFTVTYEPKKSFITDLAGNRLIQTDSGSDKKILHSIDITPPSFTMTISPVGENKIYAVFTKPLAYKGTYLSDLGNELPSVLQKISSNLEFVYSEEDNVDTSAVLSGDKAISVVDAELAKGTSDYTAILFTLDRKISLDDVEKIWIRVNDAGEGSETLFGNITASYIQDKLGNPVPVHTCHALSDFAVNAVNMLYAYSDNTDDDGWDEHEIYGQGLAPESSDYAVHDFSEDGKNYNRVRSGRDIVFQFEFIDSDNGRAKTGVQNGEALSLVYDEKANIRPEWKSSKYNLLTGSDWRIWLDNPFEAFSLSFNSSPLSASLPSPPDFADVEGSDILKNMIWKNEDFNIEAGKEYQFFFKILDSSGNVIQINHDGDTRTPRIPLYTFRMPKERISAGDFSYLDLWSFTTRDLTRQRGGVTILNNVINAALGEKTAIEVNMKNDGNLNVFVMTLDGNIIKRLSKGSVKSGTHYFYWDGKNGAGNPVARGLYFVRVSGNGIDETRKVMVVK